MTSVAPNEPPAVFISCSRQDREWFERFASSLQAHGLAVLHESLITEPDQSAAFHAALEAMWDRARVALLLVSEAFWRSTAITGDETPHLRHRHEKDGLPLVPVLIRRGAWQGHDLMRSLQMLPRSLEPLNELAEDQLPRAIDEIVAEVAQLISTSAAPNASGAAPEASGGGTAPSGGVAQESGGASPVSGVEAQQSGSSGAVSEVEAQQSGSSGAVSGVEAQQSGSSGAASGVEAQHSGSSGAVSGVEAQHSGSAGPVSGVVVPQSGGATPVSEVVTEPSGSGTSVIEPSGGPADADLVPLDQLQEFELSPTCEQIVRAAERSMHTAQAEPRLPLTSSALLFALLEIGYTGSATPPTVGAILARTIPRTAFEQCAQRYFSRQGAAPNGDFPPVSMTRFVRDLFEQAGRFAAATFKEPTAGSTAPAPSPKPRIHARHLAAALLVENAAGQPSTAQTGEVSAGVAQGTPSGENAPGQPSAAQTSEEPSGRPQRARAGEKSSGRAEGEKTDAVSSRPRAGALDRLVELGQDPASLRLVVLSWVRTSVPEDDPDRWDEILGGGPRGPQRVFLAGYDADSARARTDLLGVTPDVNAFASLIAATTVVPPLSIGLFGDWGSGKSFFMHQLKQTVETLAQEARAATDQQQKTLPYYKRIIQIEFNAWHYAEGNLWASLVEHIFDNLRVEDGSSVEALQKKILEDLRFTRAEADRATDEEKKAQERVDRAQDQVRAVVAQIDTECEQLASLTASDVLGQATLDDLPPEDRDRLMLLLEQSGIKPMSESTDDLLAAFDGARRSLERGGPVLSWLASNRNPWQQVAILAVALLVPIALAIGVDALLKWAGSPDLAQISGFFTGLAALVVGIAAGVTRAAGWLNVWTTKVEQIKQRVDARVAKRRADGQAVIKRLEQTLQRRNAEFAAARRNADEAQNKLEEKRIELARTTPGGLLASFIQDRISSNDYRQYLGVLAVIRRDFEKLSNLMDLQNWQLAKPRRGEADVREGVRRFGSIEDERKGEDERVNRIVLYIDDLDRCPPRKVVEVLQAVHLLLAFPLFVVVVGVDARWVERALATTYGRLLTGGGATPADYLEKVFQIPFWLEETRLKARRDMLHGLLEASLERELSPTAVDGTDHTGEGPANGALVGAGGGQQTTAGAEQRADGGQHAPGDNGLGQGHLGGSEEPAERGGGDGDTLRGRRRDGVGGDQEDTTRGGDGATVRGGDEQERVPPAGVADGTASGGPSQAQLPVVDSVASRPLTQGLTIVVSELEYMDQLAPILGRSPRSLKRFVNVYRLIKAGISEEGQQVFVATRQYRAVQFLLAVVTGAPALSQAMATVLERSAPDMPMRELLRQFEAEPAVTRREQWQAVSAWLTEPRAHELGDDARALLEWLPRIRRYSFGLGARQRAPEPIAPY